MLLTLSTAHSPATPVGLVRDRRGPPGEGGALEQYVNDRPYVASSFLCVALARGEPLRRVHECVFGVLALEREPVDPRL